MQRTLVSFLVVAALLLATPLQLHAASQGPNFAGTATNVPDTTQTWTNPGNATTSNDSRATVGLADIGDPDIDTSDFLKATNFGFSIPGGATLLGMGCEIEVSSITDASNDIKDAFVAAVIADVPLNIDRKNLTIWTASDVFLNHGGPGDLWGRTWTVAEANATDSGCAIRATVLGDASGGTARVDSFRATWTFNVGTKLLITQTRVAGIVEWLN